MTGRDNRDKPGQIKNVPMLGHGDTWDTPFRGGVPVSPKSPAGSALSLSSCLAGCRVASLAALPKRETIR